jgi:hypothetical protein
MDWFGVYELGTIEVAGATSSTAGGGGGGSIWPDLRWVTLTAAIVLAGVAIVDTAVTRRRRRTVTA